MIQNLPSLKRKKGKIMSQEPSITSMYGFCSNMHCHNRQFIGEIKPATVKVKMGSVIADCCIAFCKGCLECVPENAITVGKFKNEYTTIIDTIESIRSANAGSCISCINTSECTKKYLITIRKAHRTNFIEKAKYEDRENVTVQLCTECAVKNRIF